MPGDLLFRVQGNKATPAELVTLADAGLKERQDLQEWVLAHPGILGDDLRIVTFEFDRWWSSGTAPADRLDVLAIGADKRLVVAELKRDRAPDTVEMQAIKYAAMASRFTAESLASQHARFLTQRGTPTSDEEAHQLLVNHAGDLDPELLRRPRIVIVAGEFPPVVTATAVWLTEMGLDLTLVRVQGYRTEHETLITVSQLFPVKDVEEFTVTPRQAEVKAVEEKRQRQKDVTTTSRLIAGKVLADGAVLALRPVGVNEEIRSKIDAWLQEDPKRAQARWVNDPKAPLKWDADGQRHTPSGLAGSIVQEAAGVSRSLRGGEWWITEDGHDLVELAQEHSSLRERLYKEFWTRFAERLHQEKPEWGIRGQPSEWNWFEMTSPIPSSYYAATFQRGRRLGCELYIDTGDLEKNKQALAKLAAQQTQIESTYGGSLDWRPPDDHHRYGSVFADAGGGDITETDRHEEFVSALIETSNRLRAAVEPVWATLAGVANN